MYTRTSIAILLVIHIFFSPALSAQWSMHFTAGVSPQQTPAGHHIFVNRSSAKDEFRFDLARVNASYAVGLGTRLDFHPFFLTTDALFTTRQSDYDIKYTYVGNGRTDQATQYTERMNLLQFPVSLGVQLGAIDVNSGFVPQWVIRHSTELDQITGYHQDLKKFRFGWHTGIGARISNVRIGMDWQMDFNNYADHAYIGDQSMELKGRSSRWMATIGYQF